MLIAGCGVEESEDAALACAMASTAEWMKAPSEFVPQGRKSRRLTPEDRRRIGSMRWRLLDPGPGFLGDSRRFCGTQVRKLDELRISEDGDWALVRFPDEWSVEECLARRDGDRWRERECDIVVHIDPVIPSAPESPR